MSPDALSAAVVAGLTAFIAGAVTGALLDSWSWRAAADSTGMVKSAGRWFKVFPNETFWHHYRTKGLS